MIEFEALEERLVQYRDAWQSARPFPLVVIDELVPAGHALALAAEFPDPVTTRLSRSRDYGFARNKFEKSHFWEFGPASAALSKDLLDERFAAFLSALCGRKVWVDPDFHGGGMHQGGEGSFLDMHADFNLHPLHPDWFRDLNVLVYLNPNWRKEWGGELKLRHRKTGEAVEIEPAFGRCVVMETRDYTLHGYDPIRFPAGEYRRSIACYAYSALPKPMARRSTAWYPTRSSLPRRALGRMMPVLVVWKNRFFGSRTARNR